MEIAQRRQAYRILHRLRPAPSIPAETVPLRE
jgi:hypothetical protein